MTLKEELDIYDVLMTNYSVGDCVPLSAVGNFLRSHHITPADFGFSKLLPMFEALSHICTLHSEEPRAGVPLVWYVTILPRPQVALEFSGDPVEEVRDPTDSAGQIEWDILPPNMESDTVFFHYKLQSILNDNITGQRDSRITPERIAQVKQDYLDALSHNQVRYDGERDSYTFCLSTPAANGETLILSLCRSSRSEGIPWIVKYVGPDSDGLFSQRGETAVRHPVFNRPGSALRSFAYLGNMTVFLRSLADHVQEETWNFSGQEDDYSILHQYINYTFYRLQQQDKEDEQDSKICIAADGSFAAFNTGLQSRRLGEDVFAFFIPNDPEQASAWKFSCFCSSDSRDPNERRCYKMMVSEFKEPEAATYFSKITDLLFDPACEVRLSSDHIFKDNCSRFPIEFLRRECNWNSQAQAILAEIEQETDSGLKRQLFEELGNVIVEDPDLYAAMNDSLVSAVNRSIRRIRRNYKLAVPCFFPTRNVMSMMLPLSFTYTGDPCLVLVCERTYSGDYLGQTVLTLPMAYVDARLICQPGSEWLNTQRIVSSETADILETEQ